MWIGSGSRDQVTPSPWFISPRRDGWWWYDRAAINESDNVPRSKVAGSRRLFALRLPLLSQTRRRVAECREAADWCSRGLRWSNIARPPRHTHAGHSQGDTQHWTGQWSSVGQYLTTNDQWWQMNNYAFQKPDQLMLIFYLLWMGFMWKVWLTKHYKLIWRNIMNKFSC